MGSGRGNTASHAEQTHLWSAGVDGRRVSVVERMKPRARAARRERGGVVQQLIEPIQIVRLVPTDADRTAMVLRRQQHHLRLCCDMPAGATLMAMILNQ